MVVGVALLASTAAWAAAAAAAAGSPGGPTVALILVSGLTVVLCRAVSSRQPVLVPTALVAVAVGLMVADPEATFRRGPLQGPFGYANATAAFLVQATIGAFMLVLAARARIVRIAGVIAAAVFVVGVVITRSWTAAILLPVVVASSLVLERTRGARAAIVASAALLLATIVLTIALGASVPRGEGALGRVVSGTISEERVALWHDALTLMAAEPLLGVGPVRFASQSPTASADVDLRWAHNEFLQMGAETGIVGFALGVSVFLWGFAALWLGPPGRLAVLAAAALALLGMHASVDYVLHFPAVALAGAALLGTGLGARARSVQRVPARGWA